MDEENKKIKILSLPNKKHVYSGLYFPSKIVHIHLDISETCEADKNKIYRFVSKSNNVYFQNFLSPKEVLESDENILNSDFPEKYRQNLLELLSNKEIYGSPIMHVTWKGTSSKKKFSEIIKLFSSLVSKLNNSSGYLEIEEVNQRYSCKPDKENVLVPERNPTDFGIKNFKMERLRYSDFRETEVHVSFSNIKKVHPKILTNLIQAGFYLAFRKINNKLSVIATIQGFELEISKTSQILISWLVREMYKGSLRCEVVIKKENIFAYKTFGDPKLQKVIEKNSLLF